MTEGPDQPDDQAPPRHVTTSALLEGIGPMLVAGIIPLALVLLLLSAIFGEWVFKLFPVIFIGAPLALVVWSATKGRLDSDEPFHIPGHGTFTGAKKRRLLIGGGLTLFGVLLAAVFGEMLVGEALVWLRGVLVG